MTDLAQFLPEGSFFPLMRDGFDPVPEMATRRENEPVSIMELPFGIKAWLITGYDAVKAVLANATAFSNDFGNLTSGGAATEDKDPGGLGMSDPPKHTRLRKMLTPEFTMRRLARLAPLIEQIVTDQLDEIERTGPGADLVTAFALPIPSLVICELLGVPYDDRGEFQALSNSRFDFLAETSGLDAIGQSLDYLERLVVAERANPGEGLLGMLVRDYGDEVTNRELAGIADGLLTGGHETTASTLALGTLLLLSDPDHFALVRDSDEYVNRAVEELLRYLTVVQVAFPRFAREDVQVAGVTIKSGDMVLCSLSAADRDAVLGENMEAFDPRREPTSHFAFGHGIHRCIGSELAKMELRVAFPALVRRFPTMRLAIDRSDVRFRKMSIVYGVESLPVTW